MKLTQHQLIHNSGQDLWDYFFNSVPLKFVKEEGGEDVLTDEPKWMVEGLEWLHSELLDGEKFEYYENEIFVYTIFGRIGNLKKKQWKKTQMQGAHITTAVDRVGISVSRIVKEKWGVQLDYYSLPKEVKDTINAETYLLKLEKKKEKTNGKKAR